MTGQREGALILVIEDDGATREVLGRELSGAGYRVVEAEDARTGLERFAARRPDLVLLDLGLPDRDGSEVIRAIRRRTAASRGDSGSGRRWRPWRAAPTTT
jgi:two-component system KDP operon response regulator KdpE